MKKSYYNIEVEMNDEVLIYNGISEALISLNREEYSRFSDSRFLELLTKDEIRHMVAHGFIISDNKDELNMIKRHIWSAREDGYSLSVVIAPTLDCNFNCEYCYEKNIYKKDIFLKENIDSIIKYIKLRKHKIKILNISWTGGEPLMKYKLIDEITTSVLNEIKDLKIKFNSYIITNGYLLTEEILKMLNRNNIKMIQITLDGTESEHDKSRPLTSGGNTFKRILSNIKLNYEFINELVIRVNIDKTNDKNFKELTRIIKEIDRDNKIRMSISKIENTNSAYFEDKCYSNEEFIDFQINEVSKIDEDLTNVLYPRKRNRYCIADGLYGMVVAPNGLIYKCWSDIGNEKNAIGDINKFVTFINDNILESYYEFDPTNDKDCSICKFLPICIGGCPKRRIDDGKKSCLYTKESFSKIIKSFYTGKSI